MQRSFILVALVLLVLGALAAGSLAGHWPYWQRALAWNAAAPAAPEALPGARLTLQGAGLALRDAPADETLQPAVASLARAQPTRMLLTWRRGHGVAHWPTRGGGSDDALGGDALVALWLLPLLDRLVLRGELPISALDVPLGPLFPEWQDDARASITPRQLAWHGSGLATPRHLPFDPFSARSRLAAGPDVLRAALATRMVYPPGSHHQASPANLQLLAAWLERAAGMPLTELLQEHVWTPWQLGGLQLALDRPRGRPLMHCCARAEAEDWLALAVWLAGGDPRMSIPAGPGPQLRGALARTMPLAPQQGLLLRVAATGNGTPEAWSYAGKSIVLYADARRGTAAVWWLDVALAPADAAVLEGALATLLELSANQQRPRPRQ
ncbi:MAG: hypothetical protein RL026_2409 [Pseudomonadota bacterium]|jgi:hypothetical protein